MSSTSPAPAHPPFYQRSDSETFEPRFQSSTSTSTEHRSPFQIDRDRILHSPALRRLQGKTQVFHSFLIGEYDFYRTRLTHSLEVAQIGRSIVHWLSKTSDANITIDSDLVEAACLAHDLGHPPFGHTGERALHRLMQPYGGFEGNAQTLRLLTNTLFAESGAGMNPTRALLDAILKYKTLQHETPNSENHYLYDEQAPILNFVLHDQPFPDHLPPGKLRNQFRSIECQIMDWADDTAYSINDLADAIQTGFITLPKLEAWAANQSLNTIQSDHLDFLLKAMRDQRVESRLGRCIGQHIRACTLAPDNNHLSRFTQRHQWKLVIDETERTRAKLNKRIAVELVFNTPQLHQLDFKASTVLERLFEALRDRYIERPAKHKLQLLPADIAAPIEQAEDERTRARLICDWLSSLTDRTALRTHQRLFDINSQTLSEML
ncbi:dNTP triphosphohydrolase [Phragmitibacter flavus]|uniref:DNTP triphosphohydrolase n=1 Tax=Phragmitibacter flavus TaxID=2576071 RepID=A0A5R8KEP3_9BACT|nr:dNTP triphosphohydrolase [Phragmitibacter flavus]TLD70727.1 dNTP triphosphohydrolase [Phragmitibacter flavus]